MNRFYSRYRTPLPARPAHTSKRVLLLRWLATVSVFIIVLVIILTITLRLLPATDLGYSLYWLHDHAWLPFVGYTVTWFWPNSLLIWIPAGLIFLVWLGTWVSGISPVRNLHVRFLNEAIARRSTYRWLASSTRLLHKCNIRPKLLIATIDRLYQQGVLRIIAALPSPSQPESVDLAQLVDLRVRLAGALEENNSLEIIAQWHLAWLLCRLQRIREAEDDLLNSLYPAISLTPGWNNLHTVQNASIFDSSSLMAQVLISVRLSAGDRIDALPTGAQWAFARRTINRLDQLETLAEEADRRRYALDHLTQLLTVNLNGQHLKLDMSAQFIEACRLFFPSTLSQGSASLFASLALIIGLEASEPALPQASLDSLDALRFALQAYPVGSKSLDASFLLQLDRFLMSAPAPEHYALTAILAEIPQDNLLTHAAGVILSDDLDNWHESRRAWTLAAGPVETA